MQQKPLKQLLVAAESFVRRSLTSNDASHDYYHIARVRCLAKRLAEDELLSPERVQLVELCALLHDVDDWKYASAAGNGNQVKKFLEREGCDKAQAQEVLEIIDSIGFKEQLPASRGSCQGHALAKPPMSLEAQVLQDADRLDAIGAIGIARCFTFGGAFKRVLYDPDIPPRVGMTKEQYMSGAGKEHNTTINHFHEKLLLLKDLMNTKAGRRVAKHRHEYMQQFLQQFLQEWDGSVCPLPADAPKLDN